MVDEIQRIIHDNEQFVFAKKEIEAGVIAERSGLIYWLVLNDEVVQEFESLQPNFQHEKDPEPKKTLTALIKYSKNECWRS